MTDTDKFDRLLSSLPVIAEAVNSFQSEEVQKKVFDALVHSLGNPAAPSPPPQSGASATDNTEKTSSPTENNVADGGTKTTKRKSKARGSSKPSIAEIRDINFRPADKPSFRDFCADKAPSTFQEKNLIAIYYMRRMLELQSITAGHVLAAYSESSWKKPVDIANNLAVTSSRTGWIHTSNLDNLSYSTRGENHVEHDMPKTPGKS